MQSFTDQTGNEVQLRNVPQRIVSLVPSQTELLYDLGLDHEVAGITKFCIHPHEWFISKTRVGGTKKIDAAVIEQLAPDLILANKEENLKEQISELMQKFPVWVSDIKTMDHALSMIHSIGAMTHRFNEADQICSRIVDSFGKLYAFPKAKAVYLIWNDPLMAAGGDTFINEMMNYAGFENVFRNKLRYPVVSMEDIILAGAEYILLSSEPFPFGKKHAEQFSTDFPRLKVKCVDGEMFSWYGSRLLKSARYFNELRSSMDN